MTSNGRNQMNAKGSWYSRHTIKRNLVYQHRRKLLQHTARRERREDLSTRKGSSGGHLVTSSEEWMPAKRGLWDGGSRYNNDARVRNASSKGGTSQHTYHLAARYPTDGNITSRCVPNQYREDVSSGPLNRYDGASTHNPTSSNTCSRDLKSILCTISNTTSSCSIDLKE